MNIPLLLIFFRLLLAPTVILLAYILGENAKVSIVILMYLGLFSDIFDGIIARKQNISSEKLRRLDSQVDVVFWLAICVSTWILYPQLVATNAFWILCIIAMEVLSYSICLLRFGKEPCIHAIISKFWGISLLIAFTSLIGFSYAGIPFYIAIFLGLVAELDVLLIIIILPQWTHDIPSAYHAWRIRQGKEITRKKIFNG